MLDEVHFRNAGAWQAAASWCTVYGMMQRTRRIVAKLRRRIMPPRRMDGRVRLHLGCGTDYWTGYINIDSSPQADCDLRLDFTRIAEVFGDGSVSEVSMMHSLSYLRLWEARDFLVDTYQLLEPGGRLVVELPDLLKCARRALESAGNLDEYLEAVRGLYAFDIGQIERRERFTPYAFGWSAEHLRVELERVGFSSVSILEPQTHGRRVWRDVRVEATK